MTAERIDLAAFRRVKRSVERDMRKDFAAELLVMAAGSGGEMAGRRVSALRAGLPASGASAWEGRP